MNMIAKIFLSFVGLMLAGLVLLMLSLIHI